LTRTFIGKFCDCATRFFMVQNQKNVSTLESQTTLLMTVNKS